MTDREMLMMAYGAMKAICTKGSYSENLTAVVEEIEGHLYPPKTELVEAFDAPKEPKL